jgi:hypothetical protein
MEFNVWRMSPLERVKTEMIDHLSSLPLYSPKQFSKVSPHIQCQECILNNANIVPDTQTSPASSFILKTRNSKCINRPEQPTTFQNSRRTGSTISTIATELGNDTD